jgi:beta-lactamase class D
MGLDMLDNLKAEVRKEAEKGARKAVTPMVTFAIVLALYALDQSKKKGRRR